MLKNERFVVKLTELPIADRYSTGTQVTKQKLNDAFVITGLSKTRKGQESLIEEEVVEVKEPEIEEKRIPKKDQVSLQEIDDRLMTIDDFLK